MDITGIGRFLSTGSPQPSSETQTKQTEIMASYIMFKDQLRLVENGSSRLTNTSDLWAEYIGQFHVNASVLRVTAGQYTTWTEIELDFFTTHQELYFSHSAKGLLAEKTRYISLIFQQNLMDFSDYHHSLSVFPPPTFLALWSTMLRPFFPLPSPPPLASSLCSTQSGRDG